MVLLLESSCSWDWEQESARLDCALIRVRFRMTFAGFVLVFLRRWKEKAMRNPATTWFLLVRRRGK